jgi:hypothetical protein
VTILPLASFVRSVSEACHGPPARCRAAQGVNTRPTKWLRSARKLTVCHTPPLQRAIISSWLPRFVHRCGIAASFPLAEALYPVFQNWICPANTSIHPTSAGPKKCLSVYRSQNYAIRPNILRNICFLRSLARLALAKLPGSLFN